MSVEPAVNGKNTTARPNWAPMLGQWEIAETRLQFGAKGKMLPFTVSCFQ
jgi:hypothetical protein